MPIYFFQDDTNGSVKIGFSRNPRQRHLSLQTIFKRKLSILRIIQGHVRDEQWLHKKFENRRINGEWFHFSPEMMTIEPPSDLYKTYRRPQMTPSGDYINGSEPTMTNKELLALRIQLGLSKKALAQALGISVSRLTDYELGFTRGRLTPAPIPQMMVMALDDLQRTHRREKRRLAAD